MSFSVDTYDRKYLDDMTALYNRQIEDEKHIARLDIERFIELVERKSYFDPEGLLVAVEDGRVVGWVHACLAAGSEPQHDPARLVPRIRMLVFPRNRLKVGNVLVAEAIAWLKRSGYKELLAMHSKAGYPFYRGLWLGSEPKCPATMPHLQLVLEVASYKNTLESVFMTTEMDHLPEEIHARVKLEFVESSAQMAHESMRESWDGFEPMTIQALVGSQEAGSIGWVMQFHLAERLGAPCVNIWSMGVRERHRRKGIATALVSRTLLRAYQQGARFASVSTQLWNAPAHATYGKLGFKPYCIVIGRTLDLEAHEDGF